MKSKFSLVVLLLCTYLLSARDDIRVVSSSDQSITIEYTLKAAFQKKVSATDKQEQDLDSYFDSNGKPISTSFNIGVPSEFGNTIEILSTQHTFIEKRLDANSRKPAFEMTAFNPGIVTFGEYGISRDLRVQTIRIYPVALDAANNRLKVYNRIVFKINYGYAGSRDFVQISSSERMSHLLNNKKARKWGINRSSLKKQVVNSVLANGTWYRFEAPDEGMYRIDRARLSSLGIDAGTVDPRTIKMYNQGGKRLSWNVENDDPKDLNEIAIRIVGEEDGSFDDGDYILFYGRGTEFWEYSEDQNKVIRHHHPYSKKNYFWITSGGVAGKRINTIESGTSATPIVQTETKAYAHREDDNINIGKTGLDYFGDKIDISNNTLTYITPLPGLISGSLISYKFRFANISDGDASLSISETNQQFNATNLDGIASYSDRNDREYSVGFVSEFGASHSPTLANEESVLKFRITASSNEAAAHCDYYEIEYLKTLKAYDDQLILFSDKVDNEIEFRTFNFSNSQISVYDISDYSNIKLINPKRLSGGEVTYQIMGSSDYAFKNLVVNDNALKSISNIEPVSNSNIHGISPGAEYIIITDRIFSEQAERLADYRENQSRIKYKSTVVYVDEIMNEFSGGALDPSAIRNFLQHAYINWETKPFYVFLFGDGTYDYYDVEGFGNNYVPTFQTKTSLRVLYSFPFDDYYARIIGDDEKSDLAVGRVNLHNVSDSEAYVDKIISYENENVKGIWRNRITLVGDDGLTTRKDEGSTHTSQAELLARDRVPDYFSINKLYLSKFPTVISGFGRRKPDVNRAIIDAINNGTLILNYTGHGNPNVWAHEFVFERATTIPALNNDKYFFLTAATCDFGLYDNPNSISGTEELVLLKDGGAIGAFSAARLVFAGQNDSINREFYLRMMDASSTGTIGEAFYYVKQTRFQNNDEKFHLFCDPAIQLIVNSKDVVIENVNSVADGDSVQLAALSEVNIAGSIRNSDGAIDSDFSGEGIISVFDAERKRRLEDIRYDILEQGGILFRGRVSAESGRFQTTFRVPKDISYEENSGKIVAYFFNDAEDGIGSRKNIFINGTDTAVSNDSAGPEIEIFYDDISSSQAYLVNPDFNLFVKLEDETGLNTTGTGVGHRLEGVINNDEENPIDFSNFFIGDLDAGGKSGTVDYRFSDMPVGEHKINIKAWDVFNNSTSVESFFTVVSSGQLAVKDVYNYPNPFRGSTTFTFHHNLTDQLDVKIKVYTIAGRVIKELESKGESGNFVKIPWDGKDEDGNELANGTYLYKLMVKSIDGEYRKSVLGKLAVFR